MPTSHVTTTGSELPVRPLTRAEVRELREAKLYPVDPQNLDPCIEKVMQTVLNETERAEIDALPWREGAKYFHEVMRETFGARDEEKNSSTSGAGTPTAGGSPTAASA
jgi:hypothetical protein